ncbi:hypothetical protein T492DRAFT_857137, partial [Pavlovales sp. CCMP2436]
VEEVLSGLSERDRERKRQRLAAAGLPTHEEARLLSVLATISGGEAGPLARPLVCARAPPRNGNEADADIPELGSGVLLLRRTGALTAVKLGVVEPLRANSHDAHALYPTDFVSRRRFWSVASPQQREMYTCSIMGDSQDLSAGISFQIVSTRPPQFFAIGRTPLEAFTALQFSWFGGDA